MNNPFEAPKAVVADKPLASAASWRRTLILVIVFVLVARVLAWFVAPVLAAILAQVLDGKPAGASIEFMLFDIVLSMTFVFYVCYVAARQSHGHTEVTALSIGTLSAIAHLLQVGGFESMNNSGLPFWYVFFPVSVLASVAAAFAARQISANHSYMDSPPNPRA